MSSPRVIRRRVAPADGGVPQTFDGQVGASADDGFSRDDGLYNNSSGNLNIGNLGGVIDSWARIAVTVPNGATIDVAYISVNAADTASDGAQDTNIYMEDADDPAAPTSQADHAGRTRTSDFTAWDNIDYTVNVFTDSPGIEVQIQTIVDRPGWASGQDMQILWDDDGSASGNLAKPWTYDGDTSKAIKLHVEFTA